MSQQSSPFLRRVFMLDAGVSGASALLLVAAAGALAGPLGLSETLLRWLGIAFLPWAAFLVWLASKDTPPRQLVWFVIALNAIWVVDCVLVLLLGWIAPTSLGIAVVIGQAVVVALFAELQFIGLRRTVSYA